MTNPYSMGTYPQNPNMYQNNYPQDAYYSESPRSNGPSVLGTATFGAIGAGSYGAFKFRHPVTKKGEIADAFVKEVFDKNLKKNCSDSVQKYFTQMQDVMKKLDKTKTVEDLKQTLVKNKNVIENKYSSVDADVVINSLNKENMGKVKESLKNRLKGIMDSELGKIRNAISLAWDSKSKKFIKTDEFKDPKLFDIIKSTKNNVQLKKALKYGGIGAAVVGGLTLLYKMFVSPSQPRM